MPTIELSTDIASPIERVFMLSLNTDVHVSSLASSDERAVTRSGRAQLAIGDEVTFLAKDGFRWKMTARVSEFDEPFRFVDEQVRGPVRSMRHEHTFMVNDNTGTRMVDRFSFTAPLGLGGRLLALIVLAPDLRRQLAHRAADSDSRVS